MFLERRGEITAVLRKHHGILIAVQQEYRHLFKGFRVAERRESRQRLIPVGGRDAVGPLGVYRSFCNFPLGGNFSGYRVLG